MKKNRYILYLFIPALTGLLCLLGWNCREMYRFEKKQLKEEAESCIKDAAYKVQWHNGSLLSSYALMLTDKDYDSKIAFAAGFTQNRSKVSIDFFNDDTFIKSPGFDTMPVISKKFLTEKHIDYIPEKVMDIHQFDSVFKIELKKKKIFFPYYISISKRADRATGDALLSSPFIIDFFNPHVYCVHYMLPAVLIARKISPYLASTLLLSALLIAGSVFYYRSYRLQIQLSQFKESLFGNITHELKTPLTSMQLIVDEAKKNISDSATVSIPSRHIWFAEKELNRMKLIVDKILSFSKMSREQFTFNKERVNLDEIISESITIMEINTRQANGAITYDAGNKIIVPGDPTLLANAVSALIDNALKYSKAAPAIHIRMARELQYAIIAIEDNGIGIPPELNKKIFDPFFRAPTGNVYNTSGHGLGLSFVKQVMTLHGGSIRFASNETGTTFYLKFRLS